METTQPIPEWRAIADEIWALVRENARGFKELRDVHKETEKGLQELKDVQKETQAALKETDRQIKAMSAETDRQMRETAKQMKATDKQMKATDKRIGELSNRFGEMVEYMVIPNLVAKFKELGFTFTKANRTVIEDLVHDLCLEVDALLENGGQVMAVEIKSKPSTGDIRDHLERMKKLRRYADLHHDQRVYLGALAGVVFSKDVKTYALRQGLYVLEPSGETFILTEPQAQGFIPREWRLLQA
ncbi:MAG: hypothetical protein LBD93_06080 [Treponema sp.]|jgi:hypothetical protein|nr:hypothetical protein [Treponema sp.]